MTTRLRALSEAEAYARCYGGAGEDVKVVRVPRRPRYQLDVSGEDLRAAFAERLDRREPELAEGMEPGVSHDVTAAGFDAPASSFASPAVPFESPATPFASPSTPFEAPDLEAGGGPSGSPAAAPAPDEEAA